MHLVVLICLLQWFVQIHGLPCESLSLKAMVPVVYVSLTDLHVIIGVHHIKQALQWSSFLKSFGHAIFDWEWCFLYNERDRHTETFRNSGSADVFHFSSPTCILLHAGFINLLHNTFYGERHKSLNRWIGWISRNTHARTHAHTHTLYIYIYIYIYTLTGHFIR